MVSKGGRARGASIVHEKAGRQIAQIACFHNLSEHSVTYCRSMLLSLRVISWADRVMRSRNRPIAVDLVLLLHAARAVVQSRHDRGAAGRGPSRKVPPEQDNGMQVITAVVNDLPRGLPGSNGGLDGQGQRVRLDRFGLVGALLFWVAGLGNNRKTPERGREKNS